MGLVRTKSGYHSLVQFHSHVSCRLSSPTADSASLPVMHVRSADTCLGDLNAHIPGILERGNWSIFEGDILHGLEDEGGV